MKQLYIIRHGETELNRLGIVQGKGIDAPLNENGRAQAEAFFNHYKEVKFDKIYTSSLIRTQQTVKEFINIGIPYEQLANLDEMGWGAWEGKPNSAESRAAFDALTLQWQEGNLDAKFEGGESPNEIASRIKAGIAHILNRQHEKQVLICIHGRALRVLMCLMLNKSLLEMVSFTHSNTTLYRLGIGENHKITLLERDNTEHLTLIDIEKD